MAVRRGARAHASCVDLVINSPPIASTHYQIPPLVLTYSLLTSLRSVPSTIFATESIKLYYQTLRSLRRLVETAKNHKRVQARAMIKDPHQYQDDHHSRTTTPKRNTIVVTLPPTKLQTTGAGFSTPTPKGHSISDASIENTSPRTAVTARFQRLGIQNNVSPTRRTIRRSSWTVYQDQGVEMNTQASSQHPSDDAIVVNETPEPSTSSFAASESTQEEEPDATQHDVEHAMFEFRAGAAPLAKSQPDHVSPSKRARSAELDPPATPSPSKRHRQKSESPSPTLIRRSRSPSARKLLSHKGSISEFGEDSDLEMTEAELSQFWWQPSEITGHDAADPEEDNRGVNGIGYQKTKQEAYKIGQQRKKQIAEWRSREAKEARAVRAGGRKTLMGRVSKPSSRGGSPVETRVRLSPAPKGVVQEAKSPSKAVRFEVE